VCSPGPAARQPGLDPGSNASSMGCAASSEVISTSATSSRSSQSSLGVAVPSRVKGMIRLRIGAPSVDLGLIVGGSAARLQGSRGVACQRDGTTVLPRVWDHISVLSSMAGLVSWVKGEAPALPVGGAFDE